MQVDIAIMTIREDEFTAVRRYFQTERQRIPNGRSYLIGEVKTGKQTYTIAIARCSEQGTDASQRLAHYIISNLNPRLILVVGIAGGLPHDEFTLGDVVVSSRIVNPNVDAWHPDGTTDYMTRSWPSHPLVDDIISLLPGEPLLTDWTDTIQQIERPTVDLDQENMTGDDEWHKKINQSLKWHFGEKQNRSRLPTFTIGPILSSNHLMKDPVRLREILKAHRSIFAVEMEVAGVYEAAQGIDHQYPVITIRGISDIIGLRRDHRWTAYACRAAAAFTYAFIMTDPLDPPRNSGGIQRSFVSSKLFSSQLQDSALSLGTQHSGGHATRTTTDTSIPVTNLINIRGSWQETTDKHTRTWSLKQSGASITGEGIHKNLYSTNTVSLTGVIDGYNIHINAYIVENNCTINYFLLFDDRQKVMRGEWVSNCSGEKGKIELSKSK